MAAEKLTDKQRRFVVAFTGPARGNATEAARIAGYSATSRNTLTQIGRHNLTNTHIAAAIEAAFAEFRTEGAAIQRIRLAGKIERLSALWRVIEGRAARYAAESRHEAHQAVQKFWGREVPIEASTGLLVRKETISGASSTVEWAVDTGILKEMRELEKEIAAEVGELPELRVKHSGNVTHTIRRPDYSALSDDELDQLAVLAEKVAAGMVPS